MLAGLFAGDADVAPTWKTDYAQALQAGRNQGKPLAVFVATGAGGAQQVSRSGMLSAKARQALAKSYVCVYVDTALPAGKRLAAALEISKGRGLVISDRSGQIQAFHHDGDLNEADLTRQLERFANGATVRMNESNRSTRVSYYPPQGPAPARYAQPIYIGGGRGC